MKRKSAKSKLVSLLWELKVWLKSEGIEGLYILFRWPPLFADVAMKLRQPGLSSKETGRGGVRGRENFDIGMARSWNEWYCSNGSLRKDAMLLSIDHTCFFRKTKPWLDSKSGQLWDWTAESWNEWYCSNVSPCKDTHAWRGRFTLHSGGEKKWYNNMRRVETSIISFCATPVAWPSYESLHKVNLDQKFAWSRPFFPFRWFEISCRCLPTLIINAYYQRLLSTRDVFMQGTEKEKERACVKQRCLKWIRKQPKIMPKFGEKLFVRRVISTPPFGLDLWQVFETTKNYAETRKEISPRHESKSGFQARCVKWTMKGGKILSPTWLQFRPTSISPT